MQGFASRGIGRVVAAVLFVLLIAQPGFAETPRSALPTKDDFTAKSLRRFQAGLLAPVGGDYRKMPLHHKAEYFEWAIEHYHTAPSHQVHCSVMLPDEMGTPPDYGLGADTSTWNGALLAALSYKYAVTKNRRTLDHIARLLQGLHLFQEVTEFPGLAARSVLQRETPIHKNRKEYKAPDGKTYYYRGDPAKGTYNQLVGGYTVMMLLVYDDLPPESQQLAMEDLTALVAHLVKHKYRITQKNGKPTPYGNLQPLFGSQSIPFNAQVVYSIVAAGHQFTPSDHPHRKRIERAFKHLRKKHHAYYESPLRSLILPQRIGASTLVKGMNDRNHVTNAAYLGLMLDLHKSYREQTPIDREFLYRLGRTMFHSLRYIEHERNSLCNFMWCGLLGHPAVFESMIQPKERERTVGQIDYLLYTGVEQLRRFPLDHFSREGKAVPTTHPVWADQFKPSSSYAWKNDTRKIWQPTAPPNNQTNCSIDFLHAYWLMRYYRLDEHPSVRDWHVDILAR